MVVWNKYVCMSDRPALHQTWPEGTALSDALRLIPSRSLCSVTDEQDVHSTHSAWSFRPASYSKVADPSNTVTLTPVPCHSVDVLHSLAQGLLMGTKWGRNRPMQRCVLVWLPVHHSEMAVRCQLTWTIHKHKWTLVGIQVISPACPFCLHLFTLSQHVRPDAKGNLVEGRGSPNNAPYTTSPNLI